MQRCRRERDIGRHRHGSVCMSACVCILNGHRHFVHYKLHMYRGEFEAADEDEKLAMILDGVCKERGVGMVIRKMWMKRFV